MPDPAEPHPSAFPIVGVGASAGGLEAFLQLLHALPAQTGMAFVLVQHLDPHHDSRLVDLLAKATPMPVLEAAQGMRVAANHVYVIPPDTTLLLADDGVLEVLPRGEGPGPHLPVDRFFGSLAAHRSGGAAIGVVLSGTGSDGSMGLEEIKASGGVAFAQDEASAKFSGMPLAAQRTGMVDLVLSPASIAAELARLGRHPYFARNPPDLASSGPSETDETDDGFRSVVARLREATGVDFGAYRDTTVKRRITRRLMLHGGDNLHAYADRLRGDRAELDALYQDILINVTRFFREPGLFETLKQRVFPDILAARRDSSPIRIWVPGCSTGQEAYSLAIALLEFLDTQSVRPAIQIFATDLSESVALLKARNGLYPESIEAEVSPERLRRFFQREDHQWRVNKTLREIVVFARQNVAADPPFSHVDLISCRNLLIYLSPQLQRRVIPAFHYALNPGGFLVLGASETIGSHGDLFAVVDQPHRIYVRKATGGLRTYPHFQSNDVPTRQAGVRELAAEPRAMTADWQREADRVASGLYVPPGVLINDNFDILQFRGKTGPYLAPAAGEPSNNLLKMAREGLFVSARAAVLESQRTGAPVHHPGVRIRGEGVDREIDLHVVPVKLPLAGERCYLVLFEERLKRILPGADGPGPTPPPASDAEAHHLRQELASTRDYLQSLIEQRDASNEELKSANEEILSSNEELQSTNEELETAKEELQSINEELTTVNEQLQHRNAELGRLNDDMNNLMSSSAMMTVVLGVDSRIRRFTAAAGKLLGLLPGDIGRPVGHLKTAVALPEMDAIVADVVSTVQPREFDLRAADGREYQLRVHPYRTGDNRIDGAVLVLFDVDDLRRAQASLRAERDYARAIVETVREPLLVLDAQWRVRTANTAFYSLFRVSADETLDRNLFELGDRQWDIGALHEKLDQLAGGGAEVVDFEVRHDFESLGPKVMRLSARRIAREAKDEALVLLAIEDRTEVERLADQARQHMDQLVEADRSRTAFLSLLAHELRNPLAPLQYALQMLDQPGITEESAREVRESATRQARQLTRLVDDLLDVARVHHGHIEVRKERIDLAALVTVTAEAMRPECDAAGIALNIESSRKPIVVDGDEARLTQVLTNLLHNACKFTERGGRIAVTLRQDGGEAVVDVADTGIGIAPENLPRVFDMFVQVDPSVERSRGGLGIGLALVQQIVQAHGGTVAATSELGKGSEFVLRIPVATEPAHAEGDTKPAAQAARAASKRILVVDDNADGVKMLAMALKLRGHEVRVASDGPEALEVAGAWHPDAIVLDIGLPGMSGYEVARRLSGEPWRRSLKLIALSGWGQGENPERAAQAGFDAHLVKPADMRALMQLIEDTPPARA